jgi:hypothetical protein
VNEQKKSSWFRTIGGRWGLCVPATWQGWLVVASYIGLMVVGILYGVPGYYLLGLIAVLMAIRHFKGERQPR